MINKVMGIFLVVVCSFAVYGGIRFLYGVAGNAVLTLRSKGFTPVEGFIQQCTIKTTGSGSGVKGMARGRSSVSPNSYYHVHIVVAYNVGEKKYSARSFRNIRPGGYKSLKEAMAALQLIAPGQSVTWESFTEKNIDRDDAGYLCSLKLDPMVHTTISLKYDPGHPAVNDLQIRNNSVLKLFLGLVFFAFGAGMYFLLFRFFVPVNVLFQLLFLAGAVALWYPAAGQLSTMVKNYRKNHEKPHFVIVLDETTPCDAIKALVRKQ